jgi:ureidoglycolate lyase/2,4-diketo-3-deoxy-L-fuconate hydrolase
MAIPTEPVLFMKATSSVTGPDDDVLIPPGAQKVDWEVELGVVIGKEARYVSREKSLDHVAGYCRHDCAGEPRTGDPCTKT